MPRPGRRKLEGTKIGEWSVLEYISHCRYRCRCSCGTEKDIISQVLLNQQSKSCGCKTVEMRAATKRAGMKEPEKKAWTVPDKIEQDFIK